jgi:hypothetical protein
MLKRTASLSGVGLALLCGACSPTTTSSSSAILPLHTLRLYETGVGYFERAGALESSLTSLPVPAGHLDDALETLVVLNRGGHAQVHGIEFGSSLSKGMARALAGLPSEAEAPLGLEDLLRGLKGSVLEVRTSTRTWTGRLVDVLQTTEDGATMKGEPAVDGQSETDKAHSPKAAKPSRLTLVLLTDKSEIVRIGAASIESVTPKDPSYRSRLGAALDALSTRSAESVRLLHVLSGGGAVTLGYVAETPVWRASYRLVFDPASKSAVLEGWALVHNDTDEDWKGVQVELANGRPDSFLFPLAAPRYARRSLVTPNDPLATVPQLMGTTVDSIWGDQIGDASGSGGLALSGVGEGGGGRGEGIGLGSIGTVGHGAGVTVREGTSALLEVGNLAGVARATGVEAGALFVYSLKERVDLHARGSALVPFSQDKVDAEAIAWLESPGAPARSAVHFVNSTNQTLPPGTLAFFGDGGFLGESALPRLKPGDVRFLTYGVDLDIDLTMSAPSRVVEESKQLVWNTPSKVLSEHFLRTIDLSYDLENRSASERSVVLAMNIEANATLTGPDRVDFDTASNRPLAVFRAAGRKKVERSAHVVEGVVRGVGLDALTSKWLSELAARPSLPADERAIASEAAARLKEREQLAASAEQAGTELAEVEKDLARLRQDMAAFSGERAGGGQANPFAARVLAAEDKLAAVRAKLAKLTADAKAKREAAEAVLVKLAR